MYLNPEKSDYVFKLLMFKLLNWMNALGEYVGVGCDCPK